MTDRRNHDATETAISALADAGRLEAWHQGLVAMVRSTADLLDFSLSASVKLYAAVNASRAHREAWEALLGQASPDADPRLDAFLNGLMNAPLTDAPQ